MERLRVAYLGGTFDPPHAGHTALARRVLELGLSDRVLMAPAWSPPHKQGRRIGEFSHRLAMTELAAASLRAAGFEGVAATGVEAELAFSPSYSLRVLGELERRHGDWRLQLLIGTDSLLELESWFGARELAERYELIAYPRRNAAVTVAALEPYWGARLAQRLAKTVITGDFFEISSSELRKKLENGENVDNIMDVAVLSYIREHGLYKRS